MDNPADNCCRWIYGDVRGGTATWCGAPVRGGGPWCSDHRSLVYVKWRPPPAPQKTPAATEDSLSDAALVAPSVPIGT